MLVDVVRGIAIMLVAMGHTIQGVQHRGWWGTSNVGFRAGYAIYAFHMPAFFFISGVFLCASVDKRGPRQFVISRLRTILWPYLLFTTLAALATVVFARYTLVKPLSFGAFLLALLTGSTNWFLPTIFFVLVLGMLGRRLPSWAFALVAAAVSTWYPWTYIAFATRGLKFLPFLVLGMWVGSNYERIERVPAWLAGALSLALAVFILVVTGYDHRDTSLLFLPMGVLGTLMLLLFARVLGHSWSARILSMIGEASFGIFLLAAYPQGAGRELLCLGHVTDPYLQTLLPTLLAVLLPVWLFRRRARLHIAWMFALPH